MFNTFAIEKTGLSLKVIQQIQSCVAKFPEIEKVVLYGSRAKGTYRKGSDIDICLIGDRLDSNMILKLGTALDDLLLPYTFDISIYSQLDNPEFKDHIDRVGMVLP